MLKKVISTGYAIMMVLVLGLVAAGMHTLLKYLIKDAKAEKRILLIASICLLVFQAYCVWNYYFSTDWDVLTLIKASEAAAHGESLEEFREYLSTYPNNLFLVWLYKELICFFEYIRIDYRIGILWLQCILSWGTGLLLFDTAKQITENRFVAWSAWGIYLLLVGMSPWVSIPYSDSAGLIFPITILWLYVKWKGMKAKENGGTVQLSVCWLELDIA